AHPVKVITGQAVEENDRNPAALVGVVEIEAVAPRVGHDPLPSVLRPRPSPPLGGLLYQRPPERGQVLFRARAGGRSAPAAVRLTNRGDGFRHPPEGARRAVPVCPSGRPRRELVSPPPRPPLTPGPP